jgi:hypothetical protein
MILITVPQVIQTDTSCHYAYERKYVTLHAMGRHDEAIEAFDSMLSLIEQSGDPEVRRKYPWHIYNTHLTC